MVASSSVVPMPGEGIKEAVAHDLAYQLVPESAKKSPLSMGLLWLATETTFPTMFVGFSAEQSGLSLLGLLTGCFLGTLFLSIYGVMAGYLGAYTGQMQPLLTRAIFGKFGSIVVSIFLIIMGSGWYSFQAVYTGQMMKGILSLSISVTVIGVIFTILMSANNVIGFRGIGTFGRYVAPFVFLVAMYSLVKALATTPGKVLWATPHVAPTTSIIAVALLIIGSGVYGNEPDIWRFAKGKFKQVAAPMLFANLVGLFLFPAAGWAMGLVGKAPDPASQGQVIVHYSMFGLMPLGVLIILISQFALNDNNLYESINAMTNLFNARRYVSIAILLVVGVALSIWMATSSSQNVFFIVAGIGASTVPTATSIMIADVFFLPKLFGIRRDLSHVLSWSETRHINWLGLLALLFGIVVSILLSVPGSVIPNFGWSIGVAPFEGWAVAVATYLGAVAVMRKSPSLKRLLGIVSSSEPHLHALVNENSAI